MKSLYIASTLARSAYRNECRSCERCVTHDVLNDANPPMAAPASAENAEI
jgi:hypothetical protein